MGHIRSKESLPYGASRKVNKKTEAERPEYMLPARFAAFLGEPIYPKRKKGQTDHKRCDEHREFHVGPAESRRRGRKPNALLAKHAGRKQKIRGQRP